MPSRFLVFGVLGVTLVACAPSAPSMDDAQGQSSVSSSAMMDKHSEAAMESSAAAMEKEVSSALMQASSAVMEHSSAAMQPKSEAAMQPRVITITASDWAFSPSSITVKKGEKVTLQIVGESGVHGIAIPGLGISQRIEPGQTVSVSLPTDTAGAQSFFCNVPCGGGHKEMKGTITIEE